MDNNTVMDTERLDSKSFTILVVDDTPANLDLIVDFLESLGYDIMVAISGSDCLEKVSYSLPDLILLDVQMPEMDGFETCEHLKANPAWQQVPVIFLTAISDEDAKVRGFDLGAVDFVTKPVQFPELRARIQTQLRIAALNKQLLDSRMSAALGRLVVGMAHELNTPLGSSLTAVTFLNSLLIELQAKFEAQTLTLPDFTNFIVKVMELNSITNRSLERAIKLIADFKHLSIEEYNDDLVDFSLLDEMWTYLQNHELLVNKPHITLECTSSMDLNFRSYPEIWHQIMDQLINNVLVHAFPEGVAGVISIGVKVNNAQVEFRFADNGLGISPSDLEHVFEPFFTLKRTQGYSGLGLHIIWNLVHHFFKGTITCNSTLGRGCELLITIPLGYAYAN